ncbi:hypothetical protein FDF15_01995 [Clostridium botulinum]|uniref:metallophosphoesterase n=1 Tax=Clostridium botulinum TaxID=1491 RepID=UPI0007E11240|nr:metallophosphoesterase [Clostridium botulinum]KEI86147.1 hypothetical protein N492_03505 [Clostridium botulinum B2 267]MBY6995798.1 SEL1-like repeat protein [Clostridium botulinum]MBY7011851.1 SEL1-like repeat protein [Clostridium botulinum]MCR1155428.1 metallophosphoesterase [Clostridium botulinum]MCS6166421.1 hypothetical protein [Clostridium botulinum]
MRIVHLSDIHFNKDNLKDYEDFVITALLEDLEKHNYEKKIDLIFITGDLIDKGGKSFENIESAFDIFKKNIIIPIKNKFNLENDRFYFVPGNHDILRIEDSKVVESGLTQILNSTDELNKFIDDNGLEGIKRILPYKRFEKNFYNNSVTCKNISNFQSSYVIEINGKTVGINCLNTAWRCYDSDADKGKIVLGQRQVSEGYKIIKNCDIKIALMHHHLDWLADFDKEDIENFIYKYYDAIFCGHVHKGSSWTTTKSYGDVFISVAPSNLAVNINNNDKIYSNGYSILDYNVEVGKMFVNYRTYNKKSFSYVTNTILGIEGKDEFKIRNKMNIKNNFLIDIDNSIKQEMKVVNFNREHGKYLKNDDISNEFMIEKNIYEIAFTKYKEVIIDNLEMISKYSKKYSELIDNLDLITILVDKLLYRISLDNNNEYINTIIELDKYLIKINNDPTNKINVLKLIYDSICWFWKKVSSDIISGIFKRKITIQNLVKEIIELEGSDCTDDQYIKVLIEAKDTYEALYSGNDYEVTKNSDISLKCQIILCIILPIYLYKERIMDWSSELQIGEIEDIEMDQLLKSVKKEYLDLKSSFVQRNINIESIYKKIIDKKMIIIKGKSGSGKSTIIAKIIEKLSVEKYRTEFSSSIIMHSFKYSKNVHDLVNSIVTQCNSKLINKIDTKILNEIQTEYNFWTNNQTKLNKNKFNNIYDIYKKVIKEVVHNFVMEHGEIYIFIDSVELFNMLDNEIETLFIDLPINSHVIICTGDDNEGIKGVISNKLIEKYIIEIKYLTLEEISLILELSYEEENIEIIDKIYEKTKGNIKLIKDLLKRSNESELDILSFLKNSNIEINMENSKLFNNMGNKWIYFNNGVLEETLLILSIFESIDFITLEKLQSFLSYKGYDLRLPKIKKFLTKVNEQIVYTSNNKIKLNNKEFAIFVVNKFFSKNDIEKFIVDLFNWICKCLWKEYNFTVDFFKYLIKKKLINESLFRESFNNFVEQKKKNNESKDLLNMGLLMLGENKDIAEYSFKMIEAAVELNNSDAKGFLGLCLLKGEYIEQDLSRGKILINEACELGNTIAKSIFGQILIKGDCVERDSERGRKLLFEASAEGDTSAKLNLSVMLITGQGIGANPVQGKKFLCELIKDNNSRAMLFMGSFMIDGVSMERNIEEGISFIKQAIKYGSLEAKLQLARRLINGDGIIKDNVEGLRLLDELQNSGSIEAKREFATISIKEGDKKTGCKVFEELIRDDDSQSILAYSKLILDGKLPKENKKRAMELLEKEIINKNVDAMRELGIRLIEGDGIERNIEKGIKLLEDSILKSDVKSMRELGYKFVNGKDVIQNKERGENLLLAAIERGDIIAKVLYALNLIDNYVDQYSRTRALQLLEEAVSYGDVYAKLNLSDILFNGKLTKKDTKRSVQLLEECIVSGDSQASRILGYRLLNGIGVPHDIKRAKELLINARDNNDSLANIILGEAIVLGYFSECAIDYGIELLEKEIHKNNIAEKVLGTLLIKGINITQDKTRGKLLLRHAAEKGNISAMRELYNMLLDGRYLDENAEEGKKYLKKAIEANDDFSRICFAERLLDGNKFQQNINEGQHIFEDLVSKNNSEAMCEYGKRFILGNGVIKNKVRGEKLLRKSIVFGNMDAKRKLALSIIDGEIDTSSKDEAIRLLEENVEVLDQMTMVIYGSMLIDGEKIEADVNRGIQLLEECSKVKNSMGKYSLGKRLIEGKNVDQDIKRGLDLLEYASSEGDERATIYLAELNIYGRYVIKNAHKGVEMLSKLISNGNEEAKSILGYKFIKGDGIKRDKDKGVYILNDLVKKKNLLVMQDYGEMLIDGFYVEKNSLYGQKLLNDAIKSGNYYASYIMGERLLSGNSIKKHKSRGIKELKRAIRHGNIYATFEYGIRLKYGIDVPISKKRGNSLIENVLVTSDMEEKYSLGLIAYKLKDYKLATELFYDSYINKVGEASISLAYMLRRNEIKGKINLPDIYNLLEEPLKNKDQNAYINLALYYIRKDENDNKWEKVDEIFRGLDYCGKAAEWWYEISKRGDLEGELVLGLMDRYGLIPGLSDISFVDRFKKVNENGWHIPNWMFEQIIAYDEIATTKY